MGFHFKISREDFLRSIGTQQNIINRKGNMAILANMLLKTNNNYITSTVTDLEICLIKDTPAEIIEEGSITIPAKKLFEITKESRSELLSFFEKDNNWIEITSNKSLYKIAGINSDNFPGLPEYNVDSMFYIESSVLSSVIDKIMFSVSQDKDNLFLFNSAFLVKEYENGKPYVKMVSSDGYRLTLMSKEIKNTEFNENFEKGLLIPRKGLQEIRKFCESDEKILFGVETDKVIVKNNNSTLIIRLPKGDFPDFKNIFNVMDESNFLIINRERFIEGLKKINIFTEDEFHGILFDISENNIVLSSQNTDIGSARDEFEIIYSGSPISIGFNCRYFLETLQAMEGENVKVNIKTGETACFITSEEDEGFLSVIMPMKL